MSFERSRDLRHMRLALRLAARGYGRVSPNPLVGAVIVKSGRIIGQGWHQRAGEAHAEIEALRDAARRGQLPHGATLYVTLEPCCTHGRTPPCTDAIIAAGIKRVVVAATDPNPAHAGRGFRILRRAGIDVVNGLLTGEAARLNEGDRKSTRLNSSHANISYAVFCLKKKKSRRTATACARSASSRAR